MQRAASRGTLPRPSYSKVMNRDRVGEQRGRGGTGWFRGERDRERGTGGDGFMCWLVSALYILHTVRYKWLHD
jgi:hypothetical protein